MILMIVMKVYIEGEIMRRDIEALEFSNKKLKIQLIVSREAELRLQKRIDDLIECLRAFDSAASAKVGENNQVASEANTVDAETARMFLTKDGAFINRISGFFR